MALTNKQVEGVINLFITCFINSCSDEERKRIFVEFEDTFDSILNRKEKTTEDD